MYSLPNGTTTYHYHPPRAYGHYYPLDAHTKSSSLCCLLVYYGHNHHDPYPDRSRRLRHPLDNHYCPDQTPHIGLQTVNTLATETLEPNYERHLRDDIRNCSDRNYRRPVHLALSALAHGASFPLPGAVSAEVIVEPVSEGALLGPWRDTRT